MQDLNGNKMKMVPKKTRAQKAKEEHEARLQQIAQERAEAYEKFKSEYPQRMLTLLVSALNEDPNYVSVDGDLNEIEFDYHCWSDDSRRFPVTLTCAHDIDRIMSRFDDVEQDIENNRLDRIEAEAKHAKKKAALSKLTEEERELLGL